MAFAMDAVSATARFLGDPPAGQRGSTSVTKREAIVIVTATATMYFFWPERLWIFKSIFNIVFLGWVTALAFDAKDAGVEAWDGIPSWLKSYLGASGGGVAGASAQARRVWAPKEESPGQIVMLQLQQVIKNIKAAPLTQDVWELIRTLLVRCLRMALHYLENTHETLPQGTSSHAPTAQRDVHHKTASTQSYAILIRTQPVHGYGSFGPSQPLWDDFPMEMDPWDNPEPSALPVSWQSTSTSCIPPLTESLTADTHFSLCIVDKDIWESGSTTLFTKLASGRYWDIRGQDEWQRGEKWSESNVKQIIGVEVLGLIQGQDPLDACNRHFDTLRWGWEYKNISWNDVDFAILLGALVVGPKATDKCGDLFQTMETLRLEQFLVPRAQLSAGFVTAVSAMAILGTGGLAAPFVGPMVLGKLGSGAKISRRDQAIWDQRMERGRELGERIPRLRGLFDGLDGGWGLGK